MTNVAKIHGIDASGHCLPSWRMGGRGDTLSLPIARKRAQKIEVGDHVGDRNCRHSDAWPEEPPGKRPARHSGLCLDGKVARNWIDGGWKELLAYQRFLSGTRSEDNYSSCCVNQGDPYDPNRLNIPTVFLVTMKR